MYDFIAIGDTVIDAFIKLTEADQVDVRGEPDHADYKICLPFAEKIPYEEVYVLNAVGNAANGAVAAARLGLKTAIVSNLGDDQNGKDCLESFKKDGVSTEFIKSHEGIKTNYHYVLWYQSERTILTKHEKYPYELPDIGEPKWLYFSSVGKAAYPFHNVVADYLDAHPNVKLAFQPGKNEILLGKEQLSRLYQHADLFFSNVEEAERILGVDTLGVPELLKRMHALGPKTVVITDGPKGAYAFDGTNTWSQFLYPDTNPPVDRTGAGDAFASTTAVAIALGKDLPTALSWGAVNSMAVVQGIGAQAGLLTKAKLEALLESAPKSFKTEKL